MGISDWSSDVCSSDLGGKICALVCFSLATPCERSRSDYRDQEPNGSRLANRKGNRPSRPMARKPSERMRTPALEAKQKNGHTNSMAAFTLPGFDLDRFVRETLAEDLGNGLPGGGHAHTSESVIPADARFVGGMDRRDSPRGPGGPAGRRYGERR